MQAKALESGVLYASRCARGAGTVVIVTTDRLYQSTHASAYGGRRGPDRGVEPARDGSKPHLSQGYAGRTVGYLAVTFKPYSEVEPKPTTDDLLTVTAEQAAAEPYQGGPLAARGIAVILVQPREVIGRDHEVKAAEIAARDERRAQQQRREDASKAAEARADAAVAALKELGIDAYVSADRYGSGYSVTLTQAATAKLAASTLEETRS
jgi:hypothetical protein